MALAELEYIGGGGGTDIKTGTVSVTAAGQNLLFDTGLTNITKLLIEFVPTGYAAKGYGVVVYDADVSTTVYRSLSTTGSGAYGNTYDVGTNAATRCLTLNSISGGRVSCTAPSQGAGYFGDLYWTAW